MKTIFFYLFLMSFTASFGQKQRTDLQEENLKGKVKTTITIDIIPKRLFIIKMVTC